MEMLPWPLIVLTQQIWGVNPETVQFTNGCKPLTSLVFNETGGCHSFNASESNEWLKVGKDLMKLIVHEANILMKPHMECLAKEMEKIEKYEKVCSCETSGCNINMGSDDTFPQECIRLLPENTAGKKKSPFFISIVATLFMLSFLYIYFFLFI